MAAVCVRHSDVSGVWASLGCECLFASVCGALALAVVLVWDCLLYTSDAADE